MWRELVLLTLGVCGVAAAQQPDITPEANPGRPTVSTPATLTPVGYLQFETGAFGAINSPGFSSRINGTEVVKLTVQSRLQLLLESEPIVHTRSEIAQTKFGDAVIGVQAVLVGAKESRATLSLSFLHKIREAGVPEVDFGAPRNSALILFSSDALGFHFDANGLVNELQEGSIGKTQTGQTLSVSHPLRGLTVSGEVWHFTQPFLNAHAVGNLWAMAYPVRKNFVVDGGFNHGLTSTSTHWEIFAGFTYLLPHKLW